MPASSRAARCPRTTTRCWPRSSHTRRPGWPRRASSPAVLSRARIHGLVTNRDLLVAILRDEAFLAGDVSTAFLGWFRDGTSSLLNHRGASRRRSRSPSRRRERRTVQRGIPVAWRNVTSQPQRTVFEEATVEWFGGRDGYVVDGCTVVSASPTVVVLEVDGVRTSYEVSVPGHDSYDVDVDSAHGHVRLTRVPRFVDPADAVASGSLLAPMPGTVVRVAVEHGQTVERRRPGARPGGHEDAAHRERAVRRRRHGDQREDRCAGRLR